MPVVFRIEYDAVGADLLAFQDGQAVSKYSLFSSTAGVDFSKWYKDLPGYCFQEANGDYSIDYRGGQLTAAILKKEFSQDTHCMGFSARPPLVGIGYRAKLSHDLGNGKVESVGITCYDAVHGSASQVDAIPLGKSTHVLLGGAIRLIIDSCRESRDGNDIAIVPSIEVAEDCTRSQPAGRATLIVVPSHGKAHLLMSCAATFVFACDPTEVVQLL